MTNFLFTFEAGEGSLDSENLTSNNLDCFNLFFLTYVLINLLDFVCRAIINRCGFNSEGIIAVAKRLGIQHGKRMLDETSSTSPSAADEAKPGGKSGPGILGVNLGKNKTSEDAASDYVQGVHSLSQYADYLVGCSLLSSSFIVIYLVLC